MKKIITTVILTAVVVSCNKSGGNSHSVGKLENDDQKAGYAYGVNLGQQVKGYSESLKEDSLNYAELEKGINDYFDSSNKDRDSYGTGQSIAMSIHNFIKTQHLEGKVEEKYVVQGIMDVLKNDSLMFSKDSVNSFMQKYMMANQERIKNESTEKGNKFLADKKKEKNVKTTESGLVYEVIKEGTGEQPTENSMVKVNYVGKHLDGKIFDQSKKGEPSSMQVNRAVKGFQEGLKLMKVGSKYKFYIPGELAYGEYGNPQAKIDPNETLEFEVELVGVEEAPAPAQGQQQLTPEQMETLKKQMQQQGN